MVKNNRFKYSDIKECLMSPSKYTRRGFLSLTAFAILEGLVSGSNRKKEGYNVPIINTGSTEAELTGSYGQKGTSIPIINTGLTEEEYIKYFLMPSGQPLPKPLPSAVPIPSVTPQPTVMPSPSAVESALKQLKGLTGKDFGYLSLESIIALASHINRQPRGLQQDILNAPNSPQNMIGATAHFFYDSGQDSNTPALFLYSAKSLGLKIDFYDNGAYDFNLKPGLQSVENLAMSSIRQLSELRAKGQTTQEYSRMLILEQRRARIIEIENKSRSSVVNFIWHCHNDYTDNEFGINSLPDKEVTKDPRRNDPTICLYKPTDFLSDFLLSSIPQKHYNIILMTCAGNIPELMAERFNDFNRKNNANLTYTIFFSRFDPSNPTVGTDLKAIPEALELILQSYRINPAAPGLKYCPPASWRDFQDVLEKRLPAIIVEDDGQMLYNRFFPDILTPEGLTPYGSELVVGTRYKPNPSDANTNSAFAPKILTNLGEEQYHVPLLGMNLSQRL